MKGCALVRLCVAIAALGLLLAGMTAAIASEQEKSQFLGGFIKETRIVYPLRIGPWAAQGEHLYEHQELGASIRYKDERFRDRWIDLYFYPVGVLAEDGFEQVAQRTAAELRMAAEQRGESQGFEMDKLEAFDIPLAAEKDEKSAKSLPARSLSLRVPIKGTVYTSAMAITAYRLYLIKGRYSVDERAPGAEGAQAELKRFLGEIVTNTNIQSAGECWAPLPIVAKTSLDVTDDAIASIKAGDGSLRAVVYADRVYALEPESDEAKAMQLLGMSTTGRMTEGCGPHEDLNPVVPEGKREIRFEYRARASFSLAPAPRHGNTSLG